MEKTIQQVNTTYRKHVHYISMTKHQHKELNADTPLEAKKTGSEIVGFKQDKWTEVTKALVKPGTHEKFQKHNNLAKVLLATEGMTIAEATFDKLWGTGVPIHNIHSAEEDRWHGVGILGEILMEVRKDLLKRSHPSTMTSDTIEVDLPPLPEATEAHPTRGNINENTC